MPKREPTVSPLEALRKRLALAVGTHAVFDGWTAKAVESAATELGIDRDQARLAMPKEATGLIDIYIQAVDEAMAKAFPPERMARMKIREKIRALVWFRIETMTEAREAIRRAMAILDEGAIEHDVVDDTQVARARRVETEPDGAAAVLHVGVLDHAASRVIRAVVDAGDAGVGIDGRLGSAIGVA